MCWKLRNLTNLDVDCGCFDHYGVNLTVPLLCREGCKIIVAIILLKFVMSRQTHAL